MRSLPLLATLIATLAAGCQSGPPVILRNSDSRRVLEQPTPVTRRELGANAPGARLDHSRYARILQQCVDESGNVAYAVVKQLEPELNRYLVDLGNVEVEKLSRYEQAALMLNAFNAFTLKMMAENPGLRSPADVPASRGWTGSAWVINLRAISMVDLMHRWVRGHFGDARLLFGISFGALGSPPLRNEPYTGARLLEQLDDQARRTLALPRFLEWKPAAATLTIGDFFGFYRADFADDDTGLARALMPWMPAGVADALRAQPSPIIKYREFDWTLNGSW